MSYNFLYLFYNFFALKMLQKHFDGAVSCKRVNVVSVSASLLLYHLFLLYVTSERG